MYIYTQTYYVYISYVYISLPWKQQPLKSTKKNSCVCVINIFDFHSSVLVNFVERYIWYQNALFCTTSFFDLNFV